MTCPTKFIVFMLVVSCPVINMKSLLSVLGFQGREGEGVTVSPSNTSIIKKPQFVC